MFGEGFADISTSARCQHDSFLLPYFDQTILIPTLRGLTDFLTFTKSAPALPHSFAPDSPVHAMHSISTGTPLGSCLTATQLRAGLCAKYFSNTPFISAKCAMSSRNTLTLTTRSMPTPASFSMPTMFSQHCVVLSAMLPSIRAPVLSAGIWPDTKIWGPAIMAWDCVASVSTCVWSSNVMCRIVVRLQQDMDIVRRAQLPSQMLGKRRT
jgi:hypothetical protein